MPTLSRHAHQRSRPSRSRAGNDDRSIHQSFGERNGREDRQVEVHRNTPNDRGRSDSGNPAAFTFHGERRARLSRAWAFGENFERRRITTDSSGGAARLEFTRRALRFGRTDNRSPSARQFALARHPRSASRKRK